MRRERSGRLATILGLGFAATVGAAACGGTTQDARPAALATLFDLQGALAAGQPLGAGLSDLFPPLPAEAFLAAPDKIRVASAFTQGRASAYMTTDLWLNYPAVWLQPMYVLVTDWNADAPLRHVLRDGTTVARPIFPVGPDSAFWSPFWRVHYAVVPPGTPVDRYRSSRQILQDGLTVHPGPARLITARPAELTPSTDPTALLPQIEDRDFSPTFRLGEAWVDGRDEPIATIDFGPNRFEWNDRQEIVEQPLFFFFRRDDAGSWVPILEVPKIGGTGPLFANRPALVPDGRPFFGSLWRLHAVRLPPGRGAIFVPDTPALADLRRQWEALAPTLRLRLVPDRDSPINAHAAAPQHALKMLLTPDCTAEGRRFPDDCAWLDSQAAIERALPADLVPSEILVSCPYLFYAGAPVRLP